MTPRPSGAVRRRSAICELRLAEELVAAAVLEPDERAQEHADRLATRGRRCRRARPCPRPSRGTSAARAGRRGRGAAAPSRRRSGRSGRGSAPASRSRRAPWRAAAGPKSDTVARTGHARARCRRARGTRPGKPVGVEGRCRGRRRACRPRPSAAPGRPMPETSPFTSATKTGTPAADSCSARPCSVFVLPVPVAPAIRPCRVIIAQRHLHVCVAEELPVVHAAAELDRGAGRRVGGGDRRREVGIGHPGSVRDELGRASGLGDPAARHRLGRDAANEILARSLVDSSAAARFAELRWASSGTESTPAASSRSAYSEPTPSIRIRSTWLTHSRIWAPLWPVSAASASRPAGEPPRSSRCSVVSTPAPDSLVA